MQEQDEESTHHLMLNYELTQLIRFLICFSYCVIIFSVSFTNQHHFSLGIFLCQHNMYKNAPFIQMYVWSNSETNKQVSMKFYFVRLR